MSIDSMNASPPIHHHSEHQDLADEFLRCGQEIENILIINVHNTDECIVFIENDLPILVSNLIDIKSSINNKMDELPDEIKQNVIRQYIDFESKEALKFRADHQAMLHSNDQFMTKLLSLYQDHIDKFKHKLTEIEGIIILHSNSNQEPQENDTVESVTSSNWMTLVFKLAVFVIIGCIVAIFVPKLSRYLVIYLESQNLGWCLPILLCLAFGCWLSVTPSGLTPVIMSGIIFHDKLSVAVTVSYFASNLGALLNLLWIRLLVIRYEESGCTKTVMRLLSIDQLRKRKDLERLFKIWNPITIIIILRISFFFPGTINYLTAFQPEYISMKQCIIANAIGFIPQCFVFTIFGNAIELGIKQFIITMWNCETVDEGFDTINEWRVDILIFVLVVTVVIAVYVLLFQYTKRILKESEDRSSGNQ